MPVPCWEVQGVQPHLAAWGQAQPGLAGPGCHRGFLPRGKLWSLVWSMRMDPTESGVVVTGTSAQQHGVGTWDPSSEGAAALTAVPSPANRAPSTSTAVRIESMENVHPMNINYTILALHPHSLHAVIHHLLSSIPLYK